MNRQELWSKKLDLPRLQYDLLTQVRQFVLSDPPTTLYKEFQTQTIGIPSVVWQQQIENACIQDYNATNTDQRDYRLGNRPHYRLSDTI